MPTRSLTKSVILCIEARYIARLAEVNLNRQGYRVSTTSSTGEAMDLLLRDRFDIAIVDHSVGGGGYALLELIRTHEQTADVKVVMLCQQEELAELQAREHQEDQYLPVTSSFDSWLGF